MRVRRCEQRSLPRRINHRGMGRWRSRRAHRGRQRAGRSPAPSDADLRPFFTTKPLGPARDRARHSRGIARCTADLVLGEAPGGGAARAAGARAPAEGASATETPSVGSRPAARRPPARALVVDDEPDIAGMLADILVHSVIAAISRQRDAMRSTCCPTTLRCHTVATCDARDGRASLYAGWRRIGASVPAHRFITGDTLDPAAGGLWTARADTARKPFALTTCAGLSLSVRSVQARLTPTKRCRSDCAGPDRDAAADELTTGNRRDRRYSITRRPSEERQRDSDAEASWSLSY